VPGKVPAEEGRFWRGKNGAPSLRRQYLDTGYLILAADASKRLPRTHTTPVVLLQPFTTSLEASSYLNLVELMKTRERWGRLREGRGRPEGVAGLVYELFEASESRSASMKRRERRRVDSLDLLETSILHLRSLYCSPLARRML
jgi:hypothetical protein